MLSLEIRIHSTFSSSRSASSRMTASLPSLSLSLSALCVAGRGFVFIGKQGEKGMGVEPSPATKNFLFLFTMYFRKVLPQLLVSATHHSKSNYCSLFLVSLTGRTNTVMFIRIILYKSYLINILGYI